MYRSSDNDNNDTSDDDNNNNNNNNNYNYNNNNNNNNNNNDILHIFIVMEIWMYCQTENSSHGFRYPHQLSPDQY